MVFLTIPERLSLIVGFSYKKILIFANKTSTSMQNYYKFQIIIQ